MLKFGFAACSTLILNWPCLRAVSALFGGWTGGGYLGRTPCVDSSPVSAEVVVRDSTDCRAFLIGRGSFDGGVGADSEADALSPRGPRGPRSSSSASRRVGCASRRRGVRGVRGPRGAGDVGSVAGDGVGGADCFALDVSSRPLLLVSKSLKQKHYRSLQYQACWTLRGWYSSLILKARLDPELAAERQTFVID